jgi:hypothetical protein
MPQAQPLKLFAPFVVFARMLSDFGSPLFDAPRRAPWRLVLFATALGCLLTPSLAFSCTLHTNAAWERQVVVPPKIGDRQRDLVVGIRSGEVLKTSLSVTLPSRPGKPAHVHVEGPIVEFEGIAQRVLVWTRRPVSTGQGMIELPAGAALVDVWVERDEVVGSLILERPLRGNPLQPVETAFQVRVPCADLVLTNLESGLLPELPWEWPTLTDEDIPPGALRMRKDSLRAFLRPAPRWDAPRTVLARWTRTETFEGFTEFHFLFRPKKEQGDWLLVEYGLQPTYPLPISVSGWIHRSMLEPAKTVNQAPYDDVDSEIGDGHTGWCCVWDYEGPARIAVGTQLLHPVTGKPWATVRSADGFKVVIDSRSNMAQVIDIPGILLHGNSVGVPWSAVEWPVKDPYAPR